MNTNQIGSTTNNEGVSDSERRPTMISRMLAQSNRYLTRHVSLPSMAIFRTASSTSVARTLHSVQTEPAMMGSELSEAMRNMEPVGMKSCKVTFVPFLPGCDNVPTLVVCTGPEPFIKHALSDGQDLFTSTMTLKNTTNTIVTYLVRSADPTKVLFCPFPIGLLGPQEEAKVVLMSNPGRKDLKQEDFTMELVQVKAARIVVTDFQHTSTVKMEFWVDLMSFWYKCYPGLQIPRVDSQIFRPGGPAFLGEGGSAMFLSEVFQNNVIKAEKMDEAREDLDSQRVVIGLAALIGIAALSVGLFKLIN